MKAAPIGPGGANLRWVELDGPDPTRVYLHGLGASSSAYFTQVAASPHLARRRSLLVDFFGFGLSDRPESFGYSLGEHADSVAVLLQTLGVRSAAVVGHSLGGSVAIVLAHRHPDLVRSVVAVEANLDPSTPDARQPGSRGIASFSEADFVSHGHRHVLADAGEHWAATMRLADPVGLHRTAVQLTRGATPGVRAMLRDLSIPKVYVEGGASEPVAGMADLIGAGVHHVVVPGAGHNVMIDAPEDFVSALLSTPETDAS